MLDDFIDGWLTFFSTDKSDPLRTRWYDFGMFLGFLTSFAALCLAVLFVIGCVHWLITPAPPLPYVPPEPVPPPPEPVPPRATVQVIIDLLAKPEEWTLDTWKADDRKGHWLMRGLLAVDPNDGDCRLGNAATGAARPPISKPWTKEEIAAIRTKALAVLDTFIVRKSNDLPQDQPAP